MDACGGHRILLPYPPPPLRVHFSAAHSRRAHPSPAVEALIPATWRALTARNPALFNAAKFRLASHAPTPPTHTLRLGLTDYAAFQATHAAAAAPRFTRPHMALPLGNVVVAETADARVCLLVRSARVGEAAGALALPGGHPEPDALHPPARPGAGDGDGARVLAELYAAARRELVEELVLADGMVPAELRLLGLLERTPDGKPCMAFYVRLRGGEAEVRRGYDSGGGGEDGESDSLVLKPIEVLREVAQRRTVHGCRMTPELVGGAQLWLQMVEATGREGGGPQRGPSTTVAE